MFYSIYDNGAKAAMGNFASFEAIPGIEVRTVFFDPVNSYFKFARIWSLAEIRVFSFP